MKTLIAVLVLAAVPLAAPAQSWPTKPIRIIVPYAAGGALDTVTRAMALKITDSVGQPVIVDNRPGASGIIGSELTARAAPDGYTLLTQIVAHNMVQFFNKGVPYDPVKDFTPVGLVAVAPAVLVVNAALPVQNVAELVAYAKKNPGKLDYGTTGIGTMQHLGGLMFAQMTGIRIEHVPYKGGAPAVADLISGQILMGLLTASTAMPHVKAGKLRALGVIEKRRFATLPGVPAVGETLKDYGVPDSWVGVLGPAAMPAALVGRINAELRKAMGQPDVLTRLETLGLEVLTSSPEEFASRINSDVETIRKIVNAAGIKPE